LRHAPIAPEIRTGRRGAGRDARADETRPPHNEELKLTGARRFGLATPAVIAIESSGSLPAQPAA
jgi:hypothetical protein